MLFNSAPTDQRAGVAPIAFTLQTATGLSTPVTLRIRPEDLTRTEPQRVAVTQTLGRGVQGWEDNFGEGMPTLSISGNTGWRTAQGSGEDGAEAFLTLNKLISHDYPAAKQNAIDNGQDPSKVRLLYVDMLNGFTWVVSPSVFVLRRSKSRPLLFQYNINLTCLDTDVDNPLMILPFGGSVSSGLGALDDVISRIEGYGKDIEGWIKKAVDAKDQLLAPIANTVKTFVNMSNRVLNTVNGVISAGKNAINGTANDLIGMAGDIAKVGVNINRTLSDIVGLPDDLKHAFMRVSGAYQEAVCIFSNSLKPRKNYQAYDGLFGASNCSSTTGGSPASQYVNMNAFSLMNDNQKPITITSSARASITTLGNADPVLAPKDIQETNRHLNNINNGVIFNDE
ncbi:head protein [Yersinia phage fHe-Yen8-01]|nr:head protein [Yersinia phage fHe-Yen8-01]